MIDKFYKSDNILKKFIPDKKDFLNLIVTYGVDDLPLKIVGISDLQEPVVFIDKYTGIGMYLQNGSIGSLQQLQALYPGKYDNIKLAKDEVLVSDSVYKSETNSTCGVYYSQEEKTYLYIAPNNFRYKVVGTYPDKFGVDSVIDNQYYGDYLSKTILMFQNFDIYSYKDKQKTIINYFKKNKAGFESENVKLIVGNTYEKELAAYKKAAANYLNTRFVITIAIFVISLLMLFFTMKSNAINRMQEISVYRLMGITKKSILTAFALEIIMVTSYTVLPVVLILSSIIKFIAGIPSLQQHIVYPWPAAALLVISLYAVNIIIGILPVYSVVKLPPAQMVEKI
jgi:ABC-type antimicrobial peptide transport system permease subunit